MIEKTDSKRVSLVTVSILGQSPRLASFAGTQFFDKSVFAYIELVGLFGSICFQAQLGLTTGRIVIGESLFGSRVRIEGSDMRFSNILKKLLVLTLLLFPALCIALDADQRRPTSEILKKIASSNKKDLWGEITGIPVFTAKYHSDGCSGGMSATYAKLKFLHNKFGKTLPWRECCVIHDQAYYYGGSNIKKKKADEALKLCVSKTVGNENLGLILGVMMRDAVLVGGVPYFPTSYRWGYGDDFRGMEGLSTR